MHLHALNGNGGIGVDRSLQRRARTPAAVATVDSVAITAPADFSSSPLERRLLSTTTEEAAAPVPNAIPAGYYDSRSPAVRARSRNPWSPFRDAADKVTRFSEWDAHYQTLLDKHKDPIKALHAWIGRAVDHLPVVATAPHLTNRTVALLEGRTDPMFIFVLRHLFHMLGPGWALHIFHTTANEEWWVQQLDIRVGGAGEHVQLQRVEPIKFQQANALPTSRAFYERIDPSCETILLVQPDTLTLRSDWLPGVLRSGPDLSSLLRDYAYLGAPWNWCKESWCRPGGNGGLSMRKRSVMLDLASEYHCSSWECHPVSMFVEASKQDEIRMKHVEDTFFSYQLHDHAYKYNQGRSQLATPEIAASFALESQDFAEVNPYFAHKIWQYMPVRRWAPLISRVMQYYPELWLSQEEMDKFKQECREGL